MTTGSVAERQARGVLDTSAVVDRPLIDEAALPIQATITVVTLAEPPQGRQFAPCLRERSIRRRVRISPPARVRNRSGWNACRSWRRSSLRPCRSMPKPLDAFKSLVC
ncbi:MAG: hypothetical protein R6T93_02685 [Trueperaceae bacterium]